MHHCYHPRTDMSAVTSWELMALLRLLRLARQIEQIEVHLLESDDVHLKSDEAHFFALCPWSRGNEVYVSYREIPV